MNQNFFLSMIWKVFLEDNVKDYYLNVKDRLNFAAE